MRLMPGKFTPDGGAAFSLLQLHNAQPSPCGQPEQRMRAGGLL